MHPRGVSIRALLTLGLAPQAQKDDALTTLNLEFPPKITGTTIILKADFAALIDVGVTLSAPVVTATVYTGTDASPSSIISGSASVSGSIVSQKITAGTEGVVYALKWQVTTSDSQTLQMTGFLALVPNVV